MAVETVALPKRTRESSIVISDEMLDEVQEALESLPDGEAIIVAKADHDGKPFDTEAKARNYARVFANEYQEAFGDAPAEGEEPVRLLSTHSVAGELYQSGPNKGKPKGFIAAVSKNTRKPVVKRPDGAPTMRELTEQVRAYKESNPDDKRSFKNYTKLSYDELRAKVNEVTGWNEGNGTAPVTDDSDDNNDNDNE